MDGSTVDGMHKVLGLTPSGAVGLVDRLVEAELVSREAGPDNAVPGDSAHRGRAPAVRRPSVKRGSRISLALTAFLSVDAVATLRELLARGDGSGSRSEGGWRLGRVAGCADLAACRRSQGECPTYNAAVAKDSHRVLTPTR